MTTSKTLFRCVLIAVFASLPTAISAQQNQIQIFVLAPIDFPGVRNSTTPLNINDRGDIVGFYVDSSNVRRGFRRRIDGSMTAIVPPGDTGNYATAYGINNN